MYDRQMIMLTRYYILHKYYYKYFIYFKHMMLSQ